MGTDARDHRYFEGLALAHVLGGLDESDGRIFRSHLLECSDCRARVGELRALAHDLADAERDERRVRAAKAVETKRREGLEDDEDDELPAPATGPRYTRLLVLIGVVLLSGLAVWNFALRSTVANQQARVDNVTDAAELLELGRSADVAVLDDRVEATVRAEEGQAVLLIVGLPDDTPHGVYQLDSGDEVLGRHPTTSQDGRIFLLVALEHGADRLVVTRPEEGMTPEPEGRPVVEAVLPTARAGR